MSAMWSGRLERFSPLRWRASRSMEYMSPTSSRRLARRASRKVSSSRMERPVGFLLGLLGGGGGGGMMVEPGACLSSFPLAGLVVAAAGVLATLPVLRLPSLVRGAAEDFFAGAGL